jgi:hypothetical protein
MCSTVATEHYKVGLLATNANSDCRQLTRWVGEPNDTTLAACGTAWHRAKLKRMELSTKDDSHLRVGCTAAVTVCSSPALAAAPHRTATACGMLAIDSMHHPMESVLESTAHPNITSSKGCTVEHGRLHAAATIV